MLPLPEAIFSRCDSGIPKISGSTFTRPTRDRRRIVEPLVSVIIPTHNRADLVDQAVQSVLKQTYNAIETIVVDDGSTDNTRHTLNKYGDKIKYIYQERSERSRARNNGFRSSKGDYIAFLDSDDLWLPNKIERQVQVLNEKPEVGLVYAGVEFISTNGNLYTGQISWDAPTRQVLYEDLMTSNVITGSTSSVMVRRTCLEEVGLFDESMNACEDLDLYRRIAAHVRFHEIEEPLVKIRIHPDNTQHDLARMASGWEVTVFKILTETPPEFDYYKDEAIIKLLSKIASLYLENHNPHRFFLFCAKSVFRRPSWIVRAAFWKKLFQLFLEKYVKCPSLASSKSSKYDVNIFC